MKLAIHLFLLVMSLCLSGTSVASNCITKTFTNVKDNSWSEVTWVNAVSGTFEVTLTETADHFGAYGKDGKRFMKVRVNGTWKDLIPSTADKTAYRGKPALTDTVDVTENITGISLWTPTWTKTTGGGTIKVCTLDRWVNPHEVVNWTKKPGCQYQPGSGKRQGVANTIDNDKDTFWNAHPCREPSWFLLFDMKTEQELTAVQMRSAGNGNHDPRKFALDWCPDASGSNCKPIAECKRDIDDQKSTTKNASYQSCDFSKTKKRYLKISMNAWGKSGSRWYEGGGARWQYNIRDVQFKKPAVALEKKVIKRESIAGPTIAPRYTWSNWFSEEWWCWQERKGPGSGGSCLNPGNNREETCKGPCRYGDQMIYGTNSTNIQSVNYDQYSRKPIRKLECGGQRCNNIRVEFRTDRLASTSPGIDSSYSDPISEETDPKKGRNDGRHYVRCRDNSVVTEIECTQSFCDDLRVGCRGLTLATTGAAKQYGASCPGDMVAVGVTCTGSFCESPRLTCANLIPKNSAGKIEGPYVTWTFHGTKHAGFTIRPDEPGLAWVKCKKDGHYNLTCGQAMDGRIMTGRIVLKNLPSDYKRIDFVQAENVTLLHVEGPKLLDIPAYTRNVFWLRGLGVTCPVGMKEFSGDEWSKHLSVPGTKWHFLELDNQTYCLQNRAYK